MLRSQEAHRERKKGKNLHGAAQVCSRLKGPVRANQSLRAHVCLNGTTAKEVGKLQPGISIQNKGHTSHAVNSRPRAVRTMVLPRQIDRGDSLHVQW